MKQNNTFKTLSVSFVFKIGLKQNLREEDNLSTRDKWGSSQLDLNLKNIPRVHVGEQLST